MNSASTKVREWRTRLREAGKVPVTLWFDAETKARLEDLAFQQHRSPSDLAQEAIDAYHPGRTQGGASISDTQQIYTLIHQELAQVTTLVTDKVTDIVTATLGARLPTLVQERLQAALADQASASAIIVTDTIADTITDTPSLPADVTADMPAFDTRKFRLGHLCPKGHDYYGTGQSLLRLHSNFCRQCDIDKKRAQRRAQRQA